VERFNRTESPCFVAASCLRFDRDHRSSGREVSADADGNADGNVEV
jgi:hypothetical protein